MFATAATTTAQFVYNSNGDIIPFSLSDEYKDLIDTSNIKTCMLPSYNNDSLYWEANFEAMYIKKDNSNTKVGFGIDTLIMFKEVADKFNLPGGILWLYKIESRTAERLDLLFKEFDIPEGALLSIYSSHMNLIGDMPDVYDKKAWDKLHIQAKFWKMKIGNKLFIEYFEPYNIVDSPNIIIKNLGYNYQGLKKKGLKTLPPHLKKNIPGSILKKALAAESDCQYDVVCPGIPDLKTESKSICLIEFWYVNENNERKIGRGTGFFINKSNNYSDTEQPIILTSGHTFNVSNYLGKIDFSNGYDLMDVFINKQNKKCNDDLGFAVGTLLPDGNKFKVVKLGDSYDKFGVFGEYKESDDYAIIQAPGTVGDYAKYSILYAGWTSSFSPGMTGWTSIGHPSGEPQKVFIDEGTAYSPSGDYFRLHLDKGVPEKGSSGSPIFNKYKQAVGWLCTSNTECATVGISDYSNVTYCGIIGTIHSEINQYVDPIMQFNAPSYTAALPTLPDHCKNCVRDKDETDIDCGGSCLPCGFAEKKTINSKMDIKSNVKASYDIAVVPNNGELIVLNGDNTYTFEAGRDIKFHSGFVIKDGVNFKAQIKESLMSEPSDRGCQDGCVRLANVFSPNGDGINDYWGFDQAFVEKYDIVIWDRNNKVIYSTSNQAIYENGTVYAWDGTGANANGTYYGTLTYYDCKGVKRTINFSLSLFGLKTLKTVSNVDVNEKLKTELDISQVIKVFPNPSDGIFTIDCCDYDSPFTYTIYNQGGKLIMNEPVESGTKQVDLSGYPTGMYILQVKIGNDIQLRKMIKR